MSWDRFQCSATSYSSIVGDERVRDVHDIRPLQRGKAHFSHLQLSRYLRGDVVYVQDKDNVTRIKILVNDPFKCEMCLENCSIVQYEDILPKPEPKPVTLGKRKKKT